MNDKIDLISDFLLLEKSQSIVITGAAGFIGSALANELYFLGYRNLFLFDTLEYGNLENLRLELRSKLHVVNCLDYDSLLKNFPSLSIVYHFAGISSLPESESQILKVVNYNYITTVNVCEVAIKKSAKRVVFASTSAVYENNEQTVFTEDLRVKPDLFYSFTKYLSEQHLEVITKKNVPFDVIVCRFFNVYGFGQNINRLNPPFTGYLARCLLNNEKAVVYNNSPLVKRDYIYVEDLIFGLLRLLNMPFRTSYECINFSSGLSYSVADILNVFTEISEGAFCYEFADSSKIWDKYPDVVELIGRERILKEVFKVSNGDVDKFRALVGSDFEFTTLHVGLRKLVSGYSDYGG